MKKIQRCAYDAHLDHTLTAFFHQAISAGAPYPVVKNNWHKFSLFPAVFNLS